MQDKKSLFCSLECNIGCTYRFDLILVKLGATEKVSLRQRIIGTKSKQQNILEHIKTF